MKLYHFTGLRALIGDAGLAVIQPGEVDLRAIAAPDSIVSAGLKPHKESRYDHFFRSPLPPCVWLTSDADMGLMSRKGLFFSKYHDVRVTVLITSTDRRLVHWPKYFHKHGQCSLSESMEPGTPEILWRTAETFYTYFGVINRIVAITRVEMTPAV
jgi:hypothetical protein